MVWEWDSKLKAVDKWNKVRLFCIPGYTNIENKNELADKFLKVAVSVPPTGPKRCRPINPHTIKEELGHEEEKIGFNLVVM